MPAIVALPGCCLDHPNGEGGDEGTKKIHNEGTRITETNGAAPDQQSLAGLRPALVNCKRGAKQAPLDLVRVLVCPSFAIPAAQSAARLLDVSAIDARRYRFIGGFVRLRSLRSFVVNSVISAISPDRHATCTYNSPAKKAEEELWVAE